MPRTQIYGQAQSRPSLDADKLVFIDETGTSTNKARRRRRCKRGERLVSAVPQGYRLTTTFIAGVRKDRIDAPCVFNGPMNGELFVAYIEQFLALTLVFLPLYPPDLNSIEQVFSKLKALPRKAAVRSKETPWTTIGTSLDEFNPMSACAISNIPAINDRKML